MFVLLRLGNISTGYLLSFIFALPFVYSVRRANGNFYHLHRCRYYTFWRHYGWPGIRLHSISCVNVLQHFAQRAMNMHRFRQLQCFRTFGKNSLSNEMATHVPWSMPHLMVITKRYYCHIAECTFSFSIFVTCSMNFRFKSIFNFNWALFFAHYFQIEIFNKYFTILNWLDRQKMKWYFPVGLYSIENVAQSNSFHLKWLRKGKRFNTRMKCYEIMENWDAF